jgi:hypothetical protein
MLPQVGVQQQQSQQADMKAADEKEADPAPLAAARANAEAMVRKAGNEVVYLRGLLDAEVQSRQETEELLQRANAALAAAVQDLHTHQRSAAVATAAVTEEWTNKVRR